MESCEGIFTRPARQSSTGSLCLRDVNYPFAPCAKCRLPFMPPHPLSWAGPYSAGPTETYGVGVGEVGERVGLGWLMGRKSFGFAFHPSEALLPGYLFSIKKISAYICVQSWEEIFSSRRVGEPVTEYAEMTWNKLCKFQPVNETDIWLFHLKGKWRY